MFVHKSVITAIRIMVCFYVCTQVCYNSHKDYGMFLCLYTSLLCFYVCTQVCYNSIKHYVMFFRFVHKSVITATRIMVYFYACTQDCYYSSKDYGMFICLNKKESVITATRIMVCFLCLCASLL